MARRVFPAQHPFHVHESVASAEETRIKAGDGDFEAEFEIIVQRGVDNRLEIGEEALFPFHKRLENFLFLVALHRRRASCRKSSPHVDLEKRLPAFAPFASEHESPRICAPRGLSVPAEMIRNVHRAPPSFHPRPHVHDPDVHVPVPVACGYCNVPPVRTPGILAAPVRARRRKFAKFPFAGCGHRHQPALEFRPRKDASVRRQFQPLVEIPSRNEPLLVNGARLVPGLRGIFSAHPPYLRSVAEVAHIIDRRAVRRKRDVALVRFRAPSQQDRSVRPVPRLHRPEISARREYRVLSVRRDGNGTVAVAIPHLAVLLFSP